MIMEEVSTDEEALFEVIALFSRLHGMKWVGGWLHAALANLKVSLSYTQKYGIKNWFEVEWS